MSFANTLDKDIDLNDVKRSQIINFLDSKIKSPEKDPDKKWITTWNVYLNHLKYFFRWLYNEYNNKNRYEFIESEYLSQANWITPDIVKIQRKKTRRLSPYIESELWEKEDLLLIIKYEKFKRNKAALALLWDLDARNHEVTLLKIKHVRLKEKYGEGEIPYEAKTGNGPILLTCSFPYVRDWLNEHPFKNEHNASLICNLHNGAPIKAEALWMVMKQLRKRIIRLSEKGSITNKQEKERLEDLLKTKRWNPYCIRHSAITADSDYLPEYALKKKVRWSMNSKQGSRYIKSRMGNELKNKILAYNGIISENEIIKKPTILSCPRCEFVNVIENKYCSKCSYPLKPEAYDELKMTEENKIKKLEEKYENEMKQMKDDIEYKLQEIISKIDLSKV
jgi:integrase/recombinase XerD